jgi:tetratricopeptide (TPR) repeat protein
LQAGRQLGESALIERALGAFTQLDGEPAAAFGASRAAAALGRTDEALRFAREGLRRLDARGTTSPLAEPGERTWARAALDSYYLARANQSAEADALRVECEDALARYLGTNSPDGWIWVQLGALAESEGRFEEARSAYERGLHRASSETALLEGLWRAAQQLGGFEAAAAAMTRVLGSHPELARARFDLGVTRFELALAKNDASSVNEYARAEADLAAARRADPSLESAALGWEAMCRAGVGWTKLAANDLAGARAAFESMEELYPGGLRCAIEGRMRSGVDGLTYVGAGFQRDGALEDAAATFQRLFEYEPGNLDFANNAGLFARDLADKLAGNADDLARASRGEIRDPARLAELRAAAQLPRTGADDEASRRALARAADALRAKATRLFEQSFAAYERAAELAPEDVRILNDVALIQVYYLKRDWERARAWLLRAVELGERQLADTTLAKDKRFELENAWGDAHENLGVLALEHDHDVAAARKWFQRAVEIGPDPRPKVTDVWLKQCDELEARR